MAIELPLDTPERIHTWELFHNGDLASIQDGNSKSLLELYVELHAIRNKTIANHLTAFNVIRKCMESFYTNPLVKHPLIDRKDITHIRRVLFNLDRLIFERTETRPEILNGLFEEIDPHDALVLLCSAYLHDYAKGRYQLIVPDLPAELQSSFMQLHAGQFELEDYDIIEKYHALSFSTFLEVFILNGLDTQAKIALKNRYKEIPEIMPLVDFIGRRCEDAPVTILPPYAEGWLFAAIWKLRRSTRVSSSGVLPDYSLLSDIQVIGRSHKPYIKIDKDRNTLAIEDFFPINEGTQGLPHGISPNIQLLAALLRVADNLDLTRERINPESALMSLFRGQVKQDGLGKGTSLPDNYLNLLMVWLRFMIVKTVDVMHLSPEAGKSPQHTLKITLRYAPFHNWEHHLLGLRALVEKDFIDSKVISVLKRDGGLEEGRKIELEYDLEGSLHGIQDVESTLKEMDITLRNNIGDYLTVCCERHSKEICSNKSQSLSKKYSLIGPDNTIPQSHTGFWPLPPAIKLPTSRAMLYILAYLSEYRHKNIKDISDQLGLPETSDVVSKDQKLDTGKVLHIPDPTAQMVTLSENMYTEVDRLLQAYRDHPALIREKVTELEEFGYLLPFSRREPNLIPTGINGLDMVLSPSMGWKSLAPGSQIERGFKHTRNIMIMGGPGSGKTTLLIQILNWNHRFRCRRVLLLSFDEIVPVLARTYKELFGWELDFVEPVPLTADKDKSIGRADIFGKIHSLIEKSHAEIVGVDGISKLRSFLGANFSERISEFFRILQIKGISGFFSVEEREGSISMEEYSADGIISLVREGEKREIKIEKVRSQDYAEGTHSLEILDQQVIRSRNAPRLPMIPFQCGINVYPNETYYGSLHQHQQPEAPSPISDQNLWTGITDLDPLLSGSREKGGYRKGDSILVLGSAGAGKTLFGMHFIKAALGYNPAEPEQRRTEHGVLWLSFEGPKTQLERSILSFDQGVGYLECLEDSRLLFRYVPPALISPLEVLYYISALIEPLSIQRVVIDSVSEIQAVFKTPVAFRQYIRTFAELLSSSGVTTMFLSRVPYFFKSEEETGSEMASVVDTIVSIKTFDIKNSIRRGLFVLKNRGRPLQSQLQTMDIDSHRGLSVSYKGWEFEGLLSGVTGNIREPEVFLKFFYENPAEDQINKDIIQEFCKRYPDRARFTFVRKPAVYSEFWSFRGNYGAGHANIRVISVSMYMVDAFRLRDRLHDLDDFFPEQLTRKIKADFRWQRYSSERGTHDAMPSYVDIGLLVARKDLAKELSELLEPSMLEDLLVKKHCVFENNKSGGLDFPEFISWSGIQELAQVAHPALKGDLPMYTFAMPDLYNTTEFMAFFFEVLWSMGGDIYHFPIFEKGSPKTRMQFYKEHILLNKVLWQELCDQLKKRDAQGEGKNIWPLIQRSAEVLGIPSPSKLNEPGSLTAFIDFLQIKIIAHLSTDNKDVLTITPTNPYARKALEFIYDLVYESPGTVPNPNNGDFSKQALFCRKWYSQIEDLIAKISPEDSSVPRQRDDLMCIRPVPCFEDRDRKKSCTTEAVWCLALIREALSPEIGWIFIDSFTSRDWVETRARMRRGFPHRFEEIKLMEQYDREAYGILEEIIGNKTTKEKVYNAKQELITPQDKLSDEEFDRRIEDFFDGPYHDRDLGDLYKAIGQQQRFKKVLKDRGKQHITQIAVPTLSDFEPDLILRSRVPSHRPFFHVVEATLHEEITRLFSPSGRRSLFKMLSPLEKEVGKKDSEIDKALMDARKLEKQGLAEGPITKVLEEIHWRLLLSLLLGMPEEINKVSDKLKG